MKINKFMLPIRWYNRGLFPLGNKYFGVFVLNGLRVMSCHSSVDNTLDSQLWGSRFKSTCPVSCALRQGTLSSLPSPTERTENISPLGGYSHKACFSVARWRKKSSKSHGCSFTKKKNTKIIVIKHEYIHYDSAWWKNPWARITQNHICFLIFHTLTLNIHISKVDGNSLTLNIT